MAVLAVLLGFVFSCTTTTSSAAFTYDASTVARIDVYEVNAGEVRTTLLSGPVEGSGSRSFPAQGTCTTLTAPVVATNTADDLLALPGARQVDAAWGVNTYRQGGTMSTIEHINYRHAWNSGFENVSRFAEGTSVRQIQGLVDDALRYGNVTTSGNTTSIVWNTGANIGVNTAGTSVSGIQVYVRDGIIQTAFPVAAP
jgi:hypothetical protein